MFHNFDVRLGIFVVVLALLQGGRSERLIAVLLTLRGALNLLAPRWEWHNIHDWERLILFQSAFLAAFAWIAWRRRAGWLTALVILQAGSVGLEVYCASHLTSSHPMLPAFYALDLAKSLLLAWAVARRYLAHPIRPPAAGERDTDLLRAAAGAWPERTRVLMARTAGSLPG